jgi:hypothetical protein
MKTADIATLTLSAIAVAVALTTFVLNYRIARRAVVLARKPVLVFVYDATRGWVLRNVGGGPALNILVAQRKVSADWFGPVRIPPLSRDAEFVPDWLGHTNSVGLGASYTDSEGRPYTSITGNDLTEVFEGPRFGPWPETEIGRHWNQSTPEE